MSNVHRSSRSGFECRCFGSDIDSTEVRIALPTGLNEPRGKMGSLAGTASIIRGATAIVWLTDVSISLNAVSGSSTTGTTDAKKSAVTRTSRNVRPLRVFKGRTPDGVETYCVRSLLSSGPATKEFARADRFSSYRSRKGAFMRRKGLTCRPIFAALRGTEHLAP
jgi:hypothetical protein